LSKSRSFYRADLLPYDLCLITYLLEEVDEEDKLTLAKKDALGIKVKRIVPLLQALTCLVVITVNGIVLYQFLNRSGCTRLTFDFTNSDNFARDARGFGDCVRQAVDQREFPKKEIPTAEQSPFGEQSSPRTEPLP